MADQFNLNFELGPQFTIKVSHSMAGGLAKLDAPFTVSINEPVKKMFTLVAGVKSSSLFGASAQAANNVTVKITTAQALSLHRAVTFSGIYCEPTQNGLSEYAGVTTVAVGLGESTNVVRTGLLTEGGWSWTPNAPIFVGATGVLTETPGALPIRRIGWAISPTQIALDPFPIIGA